MRSRSARRTTSTSAASSTAADSTCTPELLRRCANIHLPHHRIEGPQRELSETVAVEYRADATLKLHDANDRVTSAIVVEVQLGRDKRKRFTWPSYVAGLRAQLECPVYLLVFTNKQSVARWCAQTIHVGHPDYALTPIVVQHGELPRSVDRRLVQTLPELGLLTSIAHPERDLANRTIKALEPLPSDRKQLYFDVLLSRLPAPLRASLEEEHMQNYVYQSDFARRYVAQGVLKGRLDAMRKLTLKLIEHQPPEIVDAVRDSLRVVKDEARLSALFDALSASRSPAATRRVLRDELQIDI